MVLEGVQWRVPFDPRQRVAESWCGVEAWRAGKRRRPGKTCGQPMEMSRSMRT
uniref:Predicted protein n=1 Tax=Hordeum vulgare subsp. vulgare TaxID=112509 RepID=F2D163_HORVV|nr:predicted protein [Hordeum vulgare subsp. vulgare]